MFYKYLLAVQGLMEGEAPSQNSVVWLEDVNPTGGKIRSQHVTVDDNFSLGDSLHK